MIAFIIEDERFIAQVMVLLEQSLKNSPSNYQIKILLMKLYNTIGKTLILNYIPVSFH